MGTFSHSSAEGNLERQSRESHPRTHSDDGTSVDMIDHVPFETFQSAQLQSRFIMFEDNEDGHSYDHERMNP